MKAKEKRMILILVMLTIIMLIITIVVKNNNKNKEEGIEQKQSTLVEEKEDGTKESISNKLKETKQLEDLEVTNIQITEENGEATIRANITNKTTTSKQEFPITIKVLNQNGEVIQEVGAYVGKMQAGETRAIHASINMDISEIYDVTFERK